MTPGTLVLLHSPYARSSAWGELPEMLRLHGLDAVTPDVPDASGTRYVARASLIISATAPVVPLVLIAQGGAGPLLPALALAQRAAHRKIGGYVFVDAELPRPQHLQHRHDHEGGSGTAHGEPPVAVPPDWPEAPCGYLDTGHPGPGALGGGRPVRDARVREARLRGWTVFEAPRQASPRASMARALGELIAAL